MTSFYNEWLAAVLLLAVGICMLLPPLLSARRTGTIEVPKVSLLVLPLLGVIAVQWFGAKLTYASDALLPIWILALTGAAMVVGNALGRQAGLPRLSAWICAGIVVGALANFAMQIVQLCTEHGFRIGLIHFDTGGVYYGSLGQRNHLATYFGWALVAALYLGAARRLAPTMLVSLVLVFLAGAALTASRTSWLQIVWIAAAAGFVVGRMSMQERPKGWGLVVALPVLFAVV
ncbi:MAG TPA: pilin glycosylation ligase domain-containing protein, partial [Noviherbaspirillum sp.]|nr:pilin glycosylation ligase domain-containing protein [Noviherbaspirillum sp.]